MNVTAFLAISDPTRRQIVEMLSSRELSAGDIAAHFDMTSPAVSQHLKVLRDARLVEVRVDAQRRIYKLNPAGLNEVDDWLNRVRQFWTGRLDTLEQQLKEPHD
jgi:DNA-binding transcriptional ArsR family regulator